MAFYPDELSPIDKLRSAGKSSELSDLNVMSVSRRQWKSLMLGKKDLGLNNFATIAEEKEEDISSEGSSGTNTNQKSSGTFANVHNKKITFPKPRKYVNSRVPELKEEEPLKDSELLKSSTKESVSDKKIDDLTKILNSSKMNLPEVRQLIKGKKFMEDEGDQAKPEVIVNYALNDMNMDKWKDVTASPPVLTGWPKQDEGKTKIKEEKKRIPQMKIPSKKLDQKRSQQNFAKTSKLKPNTEGKNKSMNMKDLVNVYKNLTYGTKDEIRSFVEKLSFVKNEQKEESDTNLPIMNLKALETKIKDLEKNTSQGGTQVKKRGKTGRKTRKVHADNLARHKVVKVPATLNYKYSADARNQTYGSVASSEQKRKSNDEKVPWKYVGTQSVLDKTYFVYPSYPQPERKKLSKKSDSERKKAKKDGTDEVSPTAKTCQSKVNHSKEILIRQISGVRSEGSRSVSGFALPASRSSATTVCTVEFRPERQQKPSGTDESLLIYLHGTKATFVKSPYSDKQFSRVKFFRRDGGRAPLIKGLPHGDSTNRCETVRVQLPDKKDSDRACDLLDFEEDIRNINDFLLSQSRNGRTGKGEPKSPKWKARRRRTMANDELLIDEITRDVESLQYLPDTEENRRIIGHFFDELDQRIERSKVGKFFGDNNNSPNNSNNNNNCLIPIVGY